jgi:hypothetical protein
MKLKIVRIAKLRACLWCNSNPWHTVGGLPSWISVLNLPPTIARRWAFLTSCELDCCMCPKG